MMGWRELMQQQNEGSRPYPQNTQNPQKAGEKGSFVDCVDIVDVLPTHKNVAECAQVGPLATM